MHRIPALALLLSCLVAIPAQAQPAVAGSFVSGVRLLEMCGTGNPYCAGYVAGVADTLEPMSEPGGPLPPNSLASYCPQRLTVKQAVIEFQKFVKNNPEGLQTNAAQLIGDALHMAYPCRRS